MILPTIPENVTSSWLGVLFLLLGIFIFLGGIGVLTGEKYPVNRGRLSSVVGLGFISLGIVLLIPLLFTISGKESKTRFEFLSLSAISTHHESVPDLNIPPGQHSLAGITFDINQRANTQCEYLPEGDRTLKINVSIPTVRTVHLLMGGTAVSKSFVNQEVGIITLSFSNSQSYSTRLIAGQNIRNWAQNRSEQDITDLNDPHVQEAWQSTIYLPLEDKTVIGHWDKLTIRVPENLTASTLESISVVDTSHETVGQLNPCIYIIAITVERMAE